MFEERGLFDGAGDQEFQAFEGSLPVSVRPRKRVGGAEIEVHVPRDVKLHLETALLGIAAREVQDAARSVVDRVRLGEVENHLADAGSLTEFRLDCGREVGGV
jgi:hypothetical protein